MAAFVSDSSVLPLLMATSTKCSVCDPHQKTMPLKKDMATRSRKCATNVFLGIGSSVLYSKMPYGPGSPAITSKHPRYVDRK